MRFRALSAMDILRAAEDAERLRCEHPELPAALASNAALCAVSARVFGMRRWKDGAAVLKKLSPAETAEAAKKAMEAGLLCSACREGCAAFEFSPGSSGGEGVGNPNFDMRRFEELRRG